MSSTSTIRLHKIDNSDSSDQNDTCSTSFITFSGSFHPPIPTSEQLPGYVAAALGAAGSAVVASAAVCSTPPAASGCPGCPVRSGRSPSASE